MGHSIAAQQLTSDAELLEASRRGEHAAFGELVGRYQHVVSAVTYSRTRDHALGEDVAQETFLAAWRQLHQLREPSRLRSWLCGIARNLAGKAKKRSIRDQVTPEGDIEVAARENPFDQVSSAEAERVVGEALARVPETYRDVLVLYYQEQLSVREVSEALGISEAAALQRLSRGRQYLANGVTSLVEKSLRRRPRRDLVAVVVAALPMIELSRAEAATNASSSHGGSMLKLAAAALAVVTAGTTAVIVHKSGESNDANAAIPSERSFPPAGKAALAAPRPPRAPAIAKAPERRPPPVNAFGVPDPDVDPTIDSQTYKRLELDAGPSRGPAKAPVTIVMFTDLQCKYCGKSHGTIDQLFDEYPGKLRLVVKQMPVHKTARLAAEAALAAEAQGKFWELDYLMIANPDDLSKDAILNLAKQGGLDVARLSRDLDNHTYADALEADIAAAKELDVQGTPSFVINGRMVRGALPIEEIRKTIESSLKD